MRIRQEAKIKEPWREVRQISELQKGTMKTAPNYPPLRRRLEIEIKEPWGEVKQLSELQKGTMKMVPKKYSKLPTPEALETDMQRLKVFAKPLEEIYQREIEGRRINPLFSTEPSKM